MDDVRLLYTIPSKFTHNTDYEWSWIPKWHWWYWWAINCWQRYQTSGRVAVYHVKKTCTLKCQRSRSRGQHRIPDKCTRIANGNYTNLVEVIFIVLPCWQTVKSTKWLLAGSHIELCIFILLSNWLHTVVDYSRQSFFSLDILESTLCPEKSGPPK